jgi:hypothetical protein
MPTVARGVPAAVEPCKNGGLAVSIFADDNLRDYDE